MSKSKEEVDALKNAMLEAVDEAIKDPSDANLKRIDDVIDKGGDVKSNQYVIDEDTTGTLLHYALRDMDKKFDAKYDANLLKLSDHLIKKGCDIKAEDSFGNSAVDDFNTLEEGQLSDAERSQKIVDEKAKQQRAVDQAEAAKAKAAQERVDQEKVAQAEAALAKSAKEKAVKDREDFLRSANGVKEKISKGLDAIITSVQQEHEKSKKEIEDNIISIAGGERIIAGNNQSIKGSFNLENSVALKDMLNNPNQLEKAIRKNPECVQSILSIMDAPEELISKKQKETLSQALEKTQKPLGFIKSIRFALFTKDRSKEFKELSQKTQAPSKEIKDFSKKIEDLSAKHKETLGKLQTLKVEVEKKGRIDDMIEAINGNEIVKGLKDNINMPTANLEGLRSAPIAPSSYFKRVHEEYKLQTIENTPAPTQAVAQDKAQEVAQVTNAEAKTTTTEVTVQATTKETAQEKGEDIQHALIQHSQSRVLSELPLVQESKTHQNTR